MRSNLLCTIASFLIRLQAEEWQLGSILPNTPTNHEHYTLPNPLQSLVIASP